MKITARPIKPADAAVLLPEISYTSPVSDRHPDPYVITRNPFLDEARESDSIPQPYVESPEPMQETEEQAPVNLGSPIQLSESTNRRAGRLLGLPEAPPFLNELKSYHKKYLPVAPSPSPQELSYADENHDDFNLALVCAP